MSRSEPELSQKSSNVKIQIQNRGHFGETGSDRGMKDMRKLQIQFTSDKPQFDTPNTIEVTTLQ